MLKPSVKALSVEVKSALMSVLTALRPALQFSFFNTVEYSESEEEEVGEKGEEGSEESSRERSGLIIFLDSPETRKEVLPSSER